MPIAQNAALIVRRIWHGVCILSGRAERECIMIKAMIGVIAALIGFAGSYVAAADVKATDGVVRYALAY